MENNRQKHMNIDARLVAIFRIDKGYLPDVQLLHSHFKYVQPVF